ncbi:MAG TPA: glutathione-regulated potassium-efflux system protein KefC [Casimicrobiaceae bacterium]|nr:glutathione-regulated potassium-efflux system protein KefC [Casimicrobiaceae bacterium]
MMINALVYLTAAVLCVPFARWMGLGSVLGYLMAGALIGPWGLGFVEDVETILHFSEFGVVLMLFVIGLELEGRRLREMRRAVFGGGMLQLALSGSALAAGGLALGLPWKSALIAGLAIALSSTAIAMQTMGERNLTATPMGRNAFAVLLFQDIAAIPLLAAIPLIAAGRAGVDSDSWRDVLVAVAAIGGVLVIGRYLLRPLLRIVASANIREVFTAFALLLVIAIAQLMSLAGVSTALGAFLAGVLLASSEYKHALEADIEPFKGLLLGLFFISVGMSMDFGLLQREPAAIAGLLAGLLVLKIATLVVVARVMGIESRQRLLFAGLLAQGGEFAFVVLGAARTAGILADDRAGLVTIAVALSMAATPFILFLLDKLSAWHARADDRAPDAIDERGNPVIIAGFGRFGQIVGRLLLANGIRAIVLDHDPDQIDFLRKFGYKVFYGDATRLDILRAAGVDDASLLINAIDDVDDNLALTDVVRQNFPDLPIIARARNVTHYVGLRSRGVTAIERETFESALRAGRRALETLGVDRFRAREIADSFRRHNLATLDERIEFFRDEAKVMSAAQAGREELREFFARDRAQFETEHRTGWNQE